jgi:DNA-binding protein HU-beta
MALFSGYSFSSTGCFSIVFFVTFQTFSEDNMTVTKSDLVNRMAEATGWTKVDIEIILNGLLANIIDSVKEGDRIEVRGFGSFYVKERQPRLVKNPKTNKIVSVDHRFVPVFRPAKNFKQTVNKNLLIKSGLVENES